MSIKEDMKGAFEYYYRSLKHGTYVAAVPTEESIESIVKLQKRLGIKNPIPPEELHVTLMYSRRGSPDLVPSDTFKVASPLEFKLYGENKNILVLILDSEDLQRRFEQLSVYGLRHSFEEYSPHVSLTYDYQGETMDDELIYDDKGEPIVTLEFDREFIEPLDE